MKKFLIFVALVIGGYLVYENFIKEKEVVQIIASYTKAREAVDIDAPAIQPRDFAHYEGTAKNISNEVLSNVIITYLIDAQPSTASISKINPGEVVKFKTTTVLLRNMDAAHYLKSVEYDGN